MKTRFGECDFCATESRLGQVLIKCGRINRKFAACHECREGFEEAISRLVETGQISEVRTVEKTVYQPVDRIITKSTMEPDGFSLPTVVAAYFAGVATMFLAIAFWLRFFHP